MAHRRRILAVIERRFRDPAFGLSLVAEALGLSPRHVHHVLAANGETVSDLVRKRRLAEACRLPDRRILSRQSVAMIAYPLGFADPA